MCKLWFRSAAVRIADFSWAILVLLLTCFYTAQMMNVLLKERQSKITTVEELAGQTTVKYGTISAGSAIDFFRVHNLMGNVYILYKRML